MKLPGQAARVNETPIHKIRKTRFFFFALLAISAITYLGFGLNLALNLRKVRPLPTVLEVHAACNGLWFALVVVQSWLIQRRSIRLHRVLGFASILLALGIFLTGQSAVNYFLARFYAQGKHPSPFGFYVQWASFGALYGLGMLTRKKSAHHKRYLLFSAVVMMMAGADRLFEVMGIAGGIEVRQWIPTFFCLAVVLHDCFQLRKLHAATVVGLSVYATEILLLVFGRIISRLLV
jgi:hypothetical protein